MDQHIFKAPGRCPDCGMILKPAKELDLGFQPHNLPTGAGYFQIAGGSGRESRHVTVHYYKPSQFTPQSRILIVIPGAGRNSNSYRNAWLEVASRKDILVAALGYPEETYDFAAYQMGGVVKDIKLNNPKFISTGPNARILQLQDKDIQMNPEADQNNWIFSDFDRTFDLLAKITGSKRAGYDIFGHSAGGQILHRLALFHPASKAERIVAANAGFYTLPSFSKPPPMGMEGTGVRKEQLSQILGEQLTILLGEEDNSDAAGGTLLHTPLIDKQGKNRFARGRNFFRTGLEISKSEQLQFGWKLQSVPRTGHDFARMAEVAAQLLYP
ncbi:heavy metal-binding domain-containing protein [Parasphingorhabdus litoris]|uniref:heavy metal-binding domain-containing protein n=1 Tax=Parasphingorhabdus litoris TaxID=394733 RepID=UPI001E4C8AB5|nr:heavy metal-binding domain-containing protein [Parasphingorhabdus litoris]